MTVCGVSVLKNVELVVTRKPCSFSVLDRRDRLVEHALLGDRLVVALAQPVDVDGEGEVRRRLKSNWSSCLRSSIGVRAQVDELLALDELADHLVDLRVHQRLAAGDRHHRRAAFLDRRDRLLDRHPLAQHLVRVLDLAAPVHLRLHANSGSSSTISGNFSRPRSFCLNR